ncbi:MAG: ATP-binding protein, partial [Bacteroidales bacterium]|nr:ATP-binding protein [Bacteroidales bacterium]
TGNGLNKYDRASKQFIHYWCLTEEYLEAGYSVDHFWLHSIFEDSQGVFWLGSRGGMTELNLQTGSFNIYEHDPEDAESLFYNGVMSICEDRLGFLWISTINGLDRFDKNTGKFYHYKHDGSKPGTLSNDEVSAVLADRSGTIWISTYGGGVDKYTPPNPSFKKYNPDKAEFDNFLHTIIIEDKNRMIWMGTNRGLMQLNPETGTIEKYGPDQIIDQVFEDKSGRIWFQPMQKNLYIIDQPGRLHEFRDASGSEFTGSITSINKSNNGNIWLGTWEGKVYNLNPGSGELALHLEENIIIESLCEDDSGLLWCGTREKGLFCYDPVQKKSSWFTYNPKDTSTISSNLVNQISKDKDGNLLLVAGRNLNKYDRKTGRFKRLGEKDGFPGNIVQVNEDEKGNLWMSTLTGIVKYSIQTGQFRKYGNLNGYLYKTKSGSFYLAGLEGITFFHPDSLKDNPFIPPVVITSFRLFEEPYPFSKEIHLSYKENFLSFEFAALNYVNPEKNQYAYKMEGIDQDWVYAGTRRFASYPDLDPGEYVFRVKGSNDDGVWNEEGTSMAISISPPFWKTWWAYTVYAVIFLMVLYGIRKYELNRISLKNQVIVDKVILLEKEETEKMKSRFFANISHEFRTPLTLILGPVEKIISNTSDDIIKDANIIRRNSKRLLQLINQLLDLSRLEAGKLKLEASKGNLVPFVKGIALSFESLADSKDITLDIQFEEDKIELFFDREKMMKILTNILSNAFKFTPENGRITVSVNEIKDPGKTGIVEIKIKDSGIGIHRDELPKLFDRFYQVDSSFTKEYEGTGIGLALVKELVELHHGTVKVESEIADPETGMAGYTEFTVRLPLGTAHLKNDEIIKNGHLPAIPETYTCDANNFIPKEVQEELAGTVSDNKNINLVVEDNQEMREFIKESLNGNYIIKEAVNGEQGVAIAGKIIPDLIISDLMMPKMDGNELVKILKNDEKTCHIPIILLTAKAGQESRLEGLETGADEYLTKPFDLKEMQVRIKNLIAQRKRMQEKFSKLESYSVSQLVKMPDSMDRKFLIKVGEIIERHISEEEFNIDQFCSELAMSRTQLHRKITALTGKSATLYIRSVKLAKARQMIAEKTGTISEIAYSLGFSSPAYFTRCFREEYGYPPSEIKV